MTLIVRIQLAETSRVTGTIEHVKTGEKHPILGFEAIAPLIERLVKQELQPRGEGA